MSTISISLPENQIETTDYLVKKFGFANRSEFIRALLRFINHKPYVLEEVVAYPFISPSEKSTKKIVSDFRETNKYSREFLKDLETGLKESSFFTD